MGDYTISILGIITLGGGKFLNFSGFSPTFGEGLFFGPKALLVPIFGDLGQPILFYYPLTWAPGFWGGEIKSPLGRQRMRGKWGNKEPGRETGTQVLCVATRGT